MTEQSHVDMTPESFVVEQAGILSLLQDHGRFGQSHLGLTQGGPADKHAFDWCQKLLGNNTSDTLIEISIGGLRLKSQCQSIGCITGAKTKVTLNGKLINMWQTFNINKGDVLDFGFSEQGVRCYFGIVGGFAVTQQFSSTSTVLRENIGGLTGKALTKGDCLLTQQPSQTQIQQTQLQTLSSVQIPEYQNELVLRVVLGYQIKWFAPLQVTRFLNSQFEVSKQWDRMGYRLQGPAIKCNTRAMLSEGITHGAVQIPADGQPIILLNDRQTIGGYPKIGSVFSLDLDKLTQCKQGAKIRFEAITIQDAHNLLHLANFKFQHTQLTDLQSIGSSGSVEKHL